MANVKISQLTPKGANLEATDLLEISEFDGSGYVTKSITGAEIITGATTGFVPTTRTLTINGTTQDLSANRTFTVSTGITIGTTAITSGVVGRVLFEGTGNVVSESASLFWDNVNGRLGIGTSSPATSLDVNGTARFQGNTTIGTTTTASTTLNVFSSSRADLRLKTNGSSDNSFSVYAIGGAFGSCSAQFGTNDGENASHQGGAIYTDSRTGLTAPIRLVVKGTGTTAMSTAMSVFNTTNIGINTTTDAGFKLDVNGTIRSNNTITGSNLVSVANILCGNILYGNGANSFWINSTGGATFGNQANPVASAQIEIVSTTKGFLPPRMTTTQKNAIASPATGLMVYDTTLNLISVYNGTTWITL